MMGPNGGVCRSGHVHMRALMHVWMLTASSQCGAGLYLVKFSCILLSGSIYKQPFNDKMCVLGLLQTTCIPVRVYVISTCSTGFGLSVFAGLYTCMYGTLVNIL